MLICKRCGYPETKGSVMTVHDPEADITEKGRPLYIHRGCGGTFRAVEDFPEYPAIKDVFSEEDYDVVHENLKKLQGVLGKE